MLFSAMSFAAPSMIEKPPSKNAPYIIGNELQAYNYPVLHTVGFTIPIYHTYPVGHTNDGKRMACNALGGDTGGTVLADTTTKCGKNCIDISTVNYVLTKAPCMWPVFPYYGVVGVCWNATNRGLYYTGKTVHNIPFYMVIEDYFVLMVLMITPNVQHCFVRKEEKNIAGVVVRLPKRRSFLGKAIS